MNNIISDKRILRHNAPCHSYADILLALFKIPSFYYHLTLNLLDQIHDAYIYGSGRFNVITANMYCNNII